MKSLPLLIVVNIVILGLLTYLGIGAPSLWKRMVIKGGQISWPWVLINILILDLVIVFVLTSISIYSPSREGDSNKQDIFRTNFITLMRFKWPGPLLYMYPSALGKTISPVSIALFIEVTNNKPVISRIYSYQCQALLKYDKGGIAHVEKTSGGGMNYRYKPSGNMVKEWRTLYSMGFLHDQIYFVASDGFSKSKRLDFKENSFDNLARTRQLRPGESLMGWIFFEIDQDLRGQLPEIIEIELTLRNSAGEEQIFRNRDIKTEGAEKAISYISSATWNILEGYYDLTKEKYSMCAMVDLPKILKEGAITVKPEDLESSSNDKSDLSKSRTKKP